MEGGVIVRLYIDPQSESSQKALNNIKKICKSNSNFKINVEIIDIRKNPDMAEEDKVIAIPTLIRVLPPPRKRIIGDLSDVERVSSIIFDFEI